MTSQQKTYIQNFVYDFEFVLMAMLSMIRSTEISFPYN